MELLLHHDIFLQLPKYQLYRIIDNNRLLYNANFSTLVESALAANGNILEFYNQTIIDLHDKKRITKSEIVINPKNDLNLEFSEIYLKCQENLVIAVSFNSNKNIQIPNSKHLVYNAVAKPNKHWILLQIIEGIPIVLYHVDFKKDNEIETVIQTLFKLPKIISEVTIFDRQGKIVQHDLFEHFKKNDIIVNYYTKEIGKPETEKIKKNIVKRYFKKCNYNVASKHKEQDKFSHPRRIMYEDFILTFDHDYPQIAVGINWTINIDFNPSSYALLKKDCLHFNKK